MINFQANVISRLQAINSGHWTISKLLTHWNAPWRTSKTPLCILTARNFFCRSCCNFANPCSHIYRFFPFIASHIPYLRGSAERRGARGSLFVFDICITPIRHCLSCKDLEKVFSWLRKGNPDSSECVSISFFTGIFARIKWIRLGSSEKFVVSVKGSNWRLKNDWWAKEALAHHLVCWFREPWPILQFLHDSYKRN